MSSFVNFMVVLVFLRIFDALLILEDNGWKLCLINIQEKRWIAFDFCYFFIEIILIIIYCNKSSQFVGNVLITIYFLLGVFESVFDFIVNSDKYMTIDEG